MWPQASLAFKYTSRDSRGQDEEVSPDPDVAKTDSDTKKGDVGDVKEQDTSIVHPRSAKQDSRENRSNRGQNMNLNVESRSNRSQNDGKQEPKVSESQKRLQVRGRVPPDGFGRQGKEDRASQHGVKTTHLGGPTTTTKSQGTGNRMPISIKENRERILKEKEEKARREQEKKDHDAQMKRDKEGVGKKKGSSSSGNERPLDKRMREIKQILKERFPTIDFNDDDIYEIERRKLAEYDLPTILEALEMYAIRNEENAKSFLNRLEVGDSHYDAVLDQFTFDSARRKHLQKLISDHGIERPKRCQWMPDPNHPKTQYLHIDRPSRPSPNPPPKPADHRTEPRYSLTEAFDDARSSTTRTSGSKLPDTVKDTKSAETNDKPTRKFPFSFLSSSTGRGSAKPLTSRTFQSSTTTGGDVSGTGVKENPDPVKNVDYSGSKIPKEPGKGGSEPKPNQNNAAKLGKDSSDGKSSSSKSEICETDGVPQGKDKTEKSKKGNGDEGFATSGSTVDICPDQEAKVTKKSKPKSKSKSNSKSKSTSKSGKKKRSSKNPGICEEESGKSDLGAEQHESKSNNEASNGEDSESNLASNNSDSEVEETNHQTGSEDKLAETSSSDTKLNKPPNTENLTDAAKIDAGIYDEVANQT